MRVLLLAQGSWCHAGIKALMCNGNVEICASIGDEYVATLCENCNWTALPISRQKSDSQIAERIKRDKPDIVLSIQYPYLIGPDVIGLVGGHIYNIHNAKLPEYRGHNCISFVLLNGDARHYTTLHRISECFDRGDLIDERALEICSDDTAFSVWERSKVSLEEILGKIDSSVMTKAGSPITGAGKFYSKFLKPELKVISCDESLENKNRLARAFWFPPHAPAREMDAEGNFKILCI